MNILEKEFGSNVTTRNRNTVLRVLGQMEKTVNVPNFGPG